MPGLCRWGMHAAGQKMSNNSHWLCRLKHSSMWEAMASSGEGASEAWEQLATTWAQMEKLGICGETSDT